MIIEKEVLNGKLYMEKRTMVKDNNKEVAVERLHCCIAERFSTLHFYSSKDHYHQLEHKTPPKIRIINTTREYQPSSSLSESESHTDRNEVQHKQPSKKIHMQEIIEPNTTEDDLIESIEGSINSDTTDKLQEYTDDNNNTSFDLTTENENLKLPPTSNVDTVPKKDMNATSNRKRTTLLSDKKYGS